MADVQESETFAVSAGKEAVEWGDACANGRFLLLVVRRKSISFFLFVSMRVMVVCLCCECDVVVCAM